MRSISPWTSPTARILVIARTIAQENKNVRKKAILINGGKRYDGMTEVIWDFNEFMSKEFKSLSMGLTPSGYLHVGFLSTLACALMYLKEHPNAHLIITNVENSLSSWPEKYNGVPLRFQYIEDGDLLLPKNYQELKKRNTAGKVVQNEIHDLIWRLTAIFDKRTKKEKEDIKRAFIPPKDKRWLELKENKVHHIFGAHIYVYSFLSVLERDRAFKNNMIKFLSDFDFAKVIGPLCGLQPAVNVFGNQVVNERGRYKAVCFIIPARLYCPDCYELCPEYAVVVLKHPLHPGPTLAAMCKNRECKRGRMEGGSDGYVYQNMQESLENIEFHFMLNSMRDFFNPFTADCHIFGGDYFQLEYNHSGMKAIDKISDMFRFMEQKTGQRKAFFGGPLVTIDGVKMSKSSMAFNIRDIKDIEQAFLNIVTILETARSKSYPKGLQISYEDIIHRAA
jgi:hypothetical protein